MGWCCEGSRSRPVQSSMGSATWRGDGSSRSSQASGQIWRNERCAYIDIGAPLVLTPHVAGASVAQNAAHHEQWCNALSANFLCVFVLDRFGDFVSDQVCGCPRSSRVYDANLPKLRLLLLYEKQYHKRLRRCCYTCQDARSSTFIPFCYK